MLYNIKSVTNGEYLDMCDLTSENIGTNCLISTGKVTTIICKEIAPSWEKEEARNICKELNASTSHIWKIDEVKEKDI